MMVRARRRSAVGTRRRGIGRRCRQRKTQAPQPAGPRRVGWPRLPALEQRQLDLIGLALVAAGIFFAFLVYLDWDGGAGGSRAVDGLATGRRRALPRAGGAARRRRDPRAAAGAARRAAVPRRRRSACSPRSRSAWRPGRSGWARAARAVHWDAEWVRPAAAWSARRSTGASSTRWSAASARTSSRCSCSWPRVLLLTGASIAGVVKATTDSVSPATRDMRGAVAAAAGRRSELAALETGEARVSRARRPRAPSRFWSGEDRYPDLYDEEPDRGRRAGARTGARADPSRAEPRLAEDPETDEPGVRARRSTPATLTPQGRYRARGDRRPRLRLARARRRLPQALLRGGITTRHRRPGEGRRASWSRRSATSASRRG